MLKKLYLFYIYSRIIRKNEAVFESDVFRLRRDMLQRLYTVINLPQDILSDKYSMGAEELRIYVHKVNQEMKRLGIMELVKLGRTQQIDDYNVFVQFEFKLFDVEKTANNLFGFLKGLGIGVITALLLFFLSQI